MNGGCYITAYILQPITYRAIRLAPAQFHIPIGHHMASHPAIRPGDIVTKHGNVISHDPLGPVDGGAGVRELADVFNGHHHQLGGFKDVNCLLVVNVQKTTAIDVKY